MPATIVITDPECGHSYEWLRSSRLPDSCPDCVTNVQDSGYCEDYPCCGHTDGCGYNPKHTSDYWSEYMNERLAQGYDYDDPDFYPEDY